MDLLVSAHRPGSAEPRTDPTHRILTTFALVVVIFRSISSHKRGDGWKGQLVIV